MEADEDEVEDESVVSVIFCVCVWGERRERDGRIGKRLGKKKGRLRDGEITKGRVVRGIRSGTMRCWAADR